VLACSVLLPVPAAVLATITVDGNMADWNAVLADPYQNAFDGPAMGLPDLDAPVGSTGRDLAQFAWTYDATWFYLYTRRVGPNLNRQEFWFYLDTDNDDLMEAGEPVLGVSWWGSTRVTITRIYAYSPASPGGDPLGDASGSADGWTMPGTVSGGAVLENVRGGSTNGVEMEARVPWSVLGVPPGTPMRFHVSASNSTNLPTQIDDNMGGPGGAIGSTAFPGVSLLPDRSGTIVPSGDYTAPHTLTNTAAGADTIDLTWSWSGDFAPSAVAFYHDQNANGLLDPSDPPLVDTDGDALPDSGPLAGGAALRVLTVITAPAGVVDGQVSAVVSSATSSSGPATDSATANVTVAVPQLTVVKAVDRASAAPGDVLTYTVSFTSSGVTDAHHVVVVDAVPADTVYVLGSATGAGALIEFSHDGGISFDATESAPITHLRWTLAAPLAPGDSGTATFRAVVR
jgi:uncharacterized repeat protein (TIGR01451 family)